MGATSGLNLYFDGVIFRFAKGLINNSTFQKPIYSVLKMPRNYKMIVIYYYLIFHDMTNLICQDQLCQLCQLCLTFVLSSNSSHLRSVQNNVRKKVGPANYVTIAQTSDLNFVQYTAISLIELINVQCKDLISLNMFSNCFHEASIIKNPSLQCWYRNFTHNNIYLFVHF